MYFTFTLLLPCFTVLYFTLLYLLFFLTLFYFNLLCFTLLYLRLMLLYDSYSLLYYCVAEKPRITYQPQDTTAPAGGKASLVCKGTGDPAVTYQWYKNENKLLADENVVDPENATLVVNAIERKYHEAHYRCRVSNSKGVAFSRKAFITVFRKSSCFSVSDSFFHFDSLKI